MPYFDAFSPILPHVDEHDRELIGVVAGEVVEDGLHLFARDAFSGAEIDEPRQGGLRIGGTELGGREREEGNQSDKEGTKRGEFHDQVEFWESQSSARAASATLRTASGVAGDWPFLKPRSVTRTW